MGGREMTVRGKAKHREFSQFRGGRLSALPEKVSHRGRQIEGMALNKGFLKNEGFKCRISGDLF